MCQHAHVHVVSLRAQETFLLVSTRRILQQCHVSLSFSDSRLCYLQVVCPAPDCIHLSQSSLCFFFSLAGTACCLCTKYLSPLRESGLHIAVGEGGKTEVPTCPVGSWKKKSRQGRRLPYLKG